MAGCYVERRHIAAGSSISWDITHHLFARQLQGVTIIVAERPEALLSALTKQWYKVIRQAERERASTLKADRIMELTHEVGNMQRLRFVVGSPVDNEDGTIFLASLNQLRVVPPNCHSIYVTYVLDPASKANLTKAMPSNSLLVIYQ